MNPKKKPVTLHLIKGRPSAEDVIALYERITGKKATAEERAMAEQELAAERTDGENADGEKK